MTDDTALKLLRDLLASQRLAVLSTQGDGQPYGSLVAFSATEDLRTLVFVTSRETRKFANLRADPRVALVIDNRANQEADFQAAVAVTATGRASEVSAADRSELLTRYLAKHPSLTEFAAERGCSLVRVDVETYFVVRRFQRVSEIRANELGGR